MVSKMIIINGKNYTIYAINKGFLEIQEEKLIKHLNKATILL